MKNPLRLVGQGVIRMIRTLLSRSLGKGVSAPRGPVKSGTKRPAIRRYGGLLGKGTLRDVLIVTGAAVLCSGCVRGQRFDNLVGHVARVVSGGLTRFLSDGWLHPVIASLTIRILGLTACAAGMLLFAKLFASIPSFTSYLAVSHLGEMQGRRPCQFDMLVGVSLPISFAIALCSYSSLALLAAAYFGCAYLYVRTLYDAKALHRTLEWYVRIQTPLNSVLRSMDSGEIDMEMDEPAAGPEVGK